ncbi:Chemotaxis protein CheX [Desulfovibrio sp. TomC]|nr:Chemotaxis protein CheX [Desulfovibrio sp. TomC]
MVKSMLGDEISDVMADAKDAVGEITNMISGQARAGLANMGIKMQGSTPTIIFGDNHYISHICKSTVMAIPFSTDNGDFTVEFCFQ